MTVGEDSVQYRKRKKHNTTKQNKKQNKKQKQNKTKNKTKKQTNKKHCFLVAALCFLSVKLLNGPPESFGGSLT